MNTKVIKFHQDYLEDLVDSFVESFNNWDKERAGDYLSSIYEACPDCCYAAVNDNGEFMGAILCKAGTYGKGRILIIEALQIKKEFRGQKMATLLMKRIIKTANDMNIHKISMLAPCTTEFPLSWYKKTGFRETGWIELQANTCSPGMPFCKNEVN